MSLNISTNTAALRAGTQLGINQKLLKKSFDRLASGTKLSSPVDDPGGLAVSMKLSAAVSVFPMTLKLKLRHEDVDLVKLRKQDARCI